MRKPDNSVSARERAWVITKGSVRAHAHEVWTLGRVSALSGAHAGGLVVVGLCARECARGRIGVLFDAERRILVV